MIAPLVALDGREFDPGRQTGIGRYLNALLDQVRQRPPAWRLELVAPPGFRGPDGFPARAVGPSDTLLWDLVHLPRYLKRAGARAYITPYLKFRPSRSTPVIVITCDLTDVLPDPAAPRTLRARLLRAARRAVARRAAARVTISNWSRQGIARLLDLPPESYRVIPPGIAVAPATPRAAGEARTILHLSNGKPHKNIPLLLEAYATLPPDLQAAHPLVLAGIHPDQRPALQQALRGHAFAGAVRVEGHVDEEALPLLYSRAAVFAFPSLEEGFGIPALEAMAYDVPVVASTAWALPEVAGDAAVLVDPRDARQLRDALAAVLTDGALRDRLVRRGRERAAAFSPERAGAALVEVVDEVLAHGT